MNKDNITEIVKPQYDPGQDPESEKETGKFPRVEKERKHKIFKVSLWIGIPAICLVLILWILHTWLGYWLVCIHKKWDFADKQCEWCANNLSLWFVIKGLLNQDIHEFTVAKYKSNVDFTTLKYSPDWAAQAVIRRGEDAIPYLIQLIQGRKISSKATAILCIGKIGYKSEDITQSLTQGLKDKNIYIRQCCALSLGMINEYSAIPELEKALEKESNIEFKKNIRGVIRHLKTIKEKEEINR